VSCGHRDLFTVITLRPCRAARSWPWPRAERTTTCRHAATATATTCSSTAKDVSSCRSS